MKKITIVSAASFIFLSICSLVAWMSAPFFLEYSRPLILGVSVLAVSGKCDSCNYIAIRSKDC